MSAPVSVIVLTHNEEVNIEATLKSVAGWCREIYVVDSGSTDATVNIAQRYTSKVVFHPYRDHTSQWQWAMSELPLECEWVLMLDSDFVVSERLKSLIEKDLQNVGDEVAGFFVIHRQVFLGRPIYFGGAKRWWLRLVRHKRSRPDGSELVDFRMQVDGACRKLHGVIYESNRKELDIDFWIDKHQKFSTRLAAEELLRRSGRIGWNMQVSLAGNSEARFAWLRQFWLYLPLYIRPFVYFTYRYIVRLGFLDGWEGFLYTFLQGFWFRVIVDLKLAGMQKRIREGTLTLDELESLFRHLPPPPEIPLKTQLGMERA
jgi:glycosyltransferase involved in cell wall biosynthesis